MEEESCKTLNKRFHCDQQQTSLCDIKMGKNKRWIYCSKKQKNNQPVWISNSISRTLAHQWRAEEQSILIEVQTALDDNPALTTRRIDGPLSYTYFDRPK